jgi:hypothetical protein
MFRVVGLFEEPEYLYTRGSGCPFMYPFRVVKWRIVDAIADAFTRRRAWSPARMVRRGDRVLPAQRASAAERESGACELPLTDPRNRARARIRGTLLPQRGSRDC